MTDFDKLMYGDQFEAFVKSRSRRQRAILVFIGKEVNEETMKKSLEKAFIKYISSLP